MKATLKDFMLLLSSDEYTFEDIKSILSGRKYLTEYQIAELDIPLSDKIWLLTSKMTGDQRYSFARRCALDVIDMWDSTESARKYLETGDTSLRLQTRTDSSPTGRELNSIMCAAKEATFESAVDCMDDDWNHAWKAASAAAYVEMNCLVWYETLEKQLNYAVEAVGTNYENRNQSSNTFCDCI